MAAPQTEVLITVAGTETGRFVLEPGDYVIGRNEDCPIRVDADLVSRQHAKLILNYDHALIEDLGSSNGTLVNGQPIAKDERTRLWPNQKIQVGTATIELRRLKVEVSDLSLAPSAAMVRRVLPEEFLREKKYDIGKVVAQGGMGGDSQCEGGHDRTHGGDEGNARLERRRRACALSQRGEDHRAARAPEHRPRA